MKRGFVMDDKTAIILAGGKGTRLYPYTVAIPKPLVPVGEKPILEIMIIRLAKQGFKRLIITVNHQADIIMAYFGDGSKWGVSIEYSLEDKPLGTMGPIGLVKNLPEAFLVMNGDVMTDLDFTALLEDHIKSGELFTISCHKRTQKTDYGVLHVSDGILTGFEEKPVNDYLVSMGVYAVSRQVVDHIPNDIYYGFDDLMMALLSDDIPVRVVEHQGYWMDIGRPDDYAKATDDVENGRFDYV